MCCAGGARGGGGSSAGQGGLPTDASEGKAPQRPPQQPFDRRLEGVVKAVGGGYCRLQMPLKPAAGRRARAPPAPLHCAAAPGPRRPCRSPCVSQAAPRAPHTPRRPPVPAPGLDAFDQTDAATRIQSQYRGFTVRRQSEYQVCRPGYCLVGKIPHPRGGGGYRDGWVGWPQISAFWAPPPPGGGVRERFLGVLGLCRALRSA